MPYYAVRSGRVPGIYSTWPECQAQVSGFSGAEHAKFPTREAAENFIRRDTVPLPVLKESDHPFAYLSARELTAEIRELTAEAKVTPVEFQRPEAKIAQSYQDCYTDGSFASGKAGGAAVIVSTGKGYLSPVEGAQTNNRGELTGILIALQVTEGAIRVHSDSEWCIRVLTGVYRPTKNLDLIAKVRELSRSRRVEYVKVLAHSGIKYNEIADQLADQARNVTRLTCVDI